MLCNAADDRTIDLEWIEGNLRKNGIQRLVFKLGKVCEEGKFKLI